MRTTMKTRDLYQAISSRKTMNSHPLTRYLQDRSFLRHREADTIFASFTSPKESVHGTVKLHLRPSRAHQRKQSSKVTKLRDDHVSASAASTSRAEDEEEKSNIQNDALLHRLVHTKLLSGSLNPELNLTSAERKKALSGRVLELSGQAKLGKGEKSVRQGERNKASKRVREGLLSKQKERQAQKLEEAKNLGNYHPTLKKLFEPDSENKPKKHRERGMRMGVGTFGGGVLKLSREDVHRAQGGARGPGGPKKKGRR
ncbi:unnamed protein product [Mycena citricolor]|uniref:Ribosome biogenesis protein SLX9 n=1 Tax=Mycena citricolor TaxID=2018698 RepID=A0AAD2HF33_9AGAR|nr:unnamed protein product [Mycena citricolor]